MNWISNFVRPRIRALVTKKEVPDNLWEKCPGCGAMLFKRELEETWKELANAVHTLTNNTY